MQVVLSNEIIKYNFDGATLAQMVEQAYRKRQVMGSIPVGGSKQT